MKRLFVAGFVMLVALSGCSDDPKPKFAEPSATPSSSTGQLPTTEPSITTPDPAATVRAWIEGQNEVQATGNAQPVNDLSSPACESCEELVQPIVDVHEAGGTFNSDGWRIRSLDTARATNLEATVNAAVVIPGGSTVTSAGEPPVFFETDRVIMRFTLIQDDGQWLVSFIGFLS